MRMERRPAGGRVGKKVLALFIISLYAVVVLSASQEWVAWEGPLVIGSLDVQTTDSGFPSRDEDPGGNGFFALLGMVSAGAILLLTSRRLGLRDVPPRKTAFPVSPLTRQERRPNSPTETEDRSPQPILQRPERN
jgi:hypothetical protein